MEFHRINEETIRCILTEEDLQEYNVTFGDFIGNKLDENIRGFLRKIVEMAAEELGYENKSGVISMHVMPTENNCILIEFSERKNKSLDDILSNLNEMNERLSKVLPKEVSDSVDKIFNTSKGKSESKEKNINKETEKDLDVSKDKKNYENEIKIFTFLTMDDIFQYILGVDEMNILVKSRLYKSLEDGRFYLILENNNLSHKEFNRISSRLLEFSTFNGNSKAREAFIMEHCQCIIKERAIETLVNI